MRTELFFLGFLQMKVNASCSSLNMAMETRSRMIRLDERRNGPVLRVTDAAQHVG